MIRRKAELKTTAVRKLLPEAWGFLCPVHTPDGSPCGLLNHLAHSCRLTTVDPDVAHLPQLLASLGMDQTYDRPAMASSSQTIQLDGRIIGSASPAVCSAIATSLRIWKTEGSHRVPLDLEVGLVPASKGGQYPGLYLFSTRGRMMRPVKLLANGLADHVGPFEQVYLGIACGADEVVPGVTTHAEFSPTHVLSLLANLTPFSDCNQSPRNMYQCQMSKQTMGTPSTALPHRTDNKLYRLHTGQTPVVRPSLHDAYRMDDFPNGTNAVVAVISYTGYDMEDAMILNKSAHERGFGNGTIYKSHIVDLQDGSSRGNTSKTFGIGRDMVTSGLTLDADGIAPVGSRVKAGDPLCAFVDGATGKTHLEKYKGDEIAFVDEVRAIGAPVSMPLELARATHCGLQPATSRKPLAPSSTSSSAFRGPLSSATSSPPATVKRASALKSGQPSTCPLASRACSPT